MPFPIEVSAEAAGGRVRPNRLFGFSSRLKGFVIVAEAAFESALLGLEDFLSLVDLVEPFGLGAERALAFGSINDGLVCGGDAADGKFGSGVFYAAAVEFSGGGCDYPLASQVDARRIVGLLFHRILLAEELLINIKLSLSIIVSSIIAPSARGVLGVHEDRVVVPGIRVFRNLGRHDVVRLLRHFRVQQLVDLEVRLVVVRLHRRLRQGLPPVCRGVLGGVQNVVFQLRTGHPRLWTCVLGRLRHRLALGVGELFLATELVHLGEEGLLIVWKFLPLHSFQFTLYNNTLILSGAGSRGCFCGPS